MLVLFSSETAGGKCSASAPQGLPGPRAPRQGPWAPHHLPIVSMLSAKPGTTGSGHTKTQRKADRMRDLSCPVHSVFECVCVCTRGNVQEEEPRSRFLSYRGPCHQMTHVIDMKSQKTLLFLFFSRHTCLDLLIIIFYLFSHRAKSISP